MLKSVQTSEQFDGAITQATNYRLEAELLGIPLWLLANGHEAQAVQVMRSIGQQPRELFVRHVHRALWAAYAELSKRGLAPTEAWLQQILMQSGDWSTDESDRAAVTVGLLDELAEAGTCKLTMASSDSPMTMVQEIVGELWSLYRRRAVIHSVEDLHHQVTSWTGRTDSDISGAIDEVRQAFALKPDSQESAQTLSQLVRRDIQVIERQMSGEEPEQRIISGFSSLDNLTGGFVRGNLVILAARPAMGKTSLALDLSLFAAGGDVLTAFFSFEMSRQELTRRIVSKACRIPVLRMRHGNLTDWQLDGYRSHFGEGSDLPLIIDDANYTPDGIEARIRHFNTLVHPGRVKLAVCDHLQIMGTRDKTRYERRDRQLATYTGQLKEMAKRLDLVIVCLSQLNRQSENRPPDQRLPRLSDLRESGAIEADADVVLGLYRKHVDSQNEADRNHADLVILKNRSGPTGRIPLTWNGALATFTDPAGRDAEVNLEHI
ncbi:MAG: DnaB-like helicase C-terminal domain-containing protein [Pseudomonadota bacterium]